ncbi:MAG TPA: c-type cytochrome [Verrucomicrobiae bacterium]|nr:c-type cytochrome [Verrucomicrobiae bacterium]
MAIWRWLGLTLGALTLCALGFVGWVYAASEAHYRSFPAPPAFTQPIPEDATTIAYGQRLARTRGCYGCHGEALQGEIMWGNVQTPNLPALARSETPAALEAAIRHGIGHDGRALYSMPAYNFLRMRDEDVAALIAFLRTAPVSTEAPSGDWAPWFERVSTDFVIRLEIAKGADGAIPQHLHLVPELSQQQNADARIARGEYLAMTGCNECHGMSLRADYPWPSDAPDLIVMGAYSEPDFTRLMREGTPSSGAELPMMGPVARGRFTHWTDDEIADLYVYLTDMSRRAIEAEAPD